MADQPAPGVEGKDWAYDPFNYQMPAWKDDPSFHTSPTPTPAPQQNNNPFIGQVLAAQSTQGVNNADYAANILGYGYNGGAGNLQGPMSIGANQSLFPQNYPAFNPSQSQSAQIFQQGPNGTYSGQSVPGGWSAPYIDIEDHGQWGTGKNNGPIVNGTMQTGGGGFTPDGSYSAGYHGSGDHPEITGNSLPGIWDHGSFGEITSPDLSNISKATDFIHYLGNLGYDTSAANLNNIVQDQYYANGNKFDGVAFMRTLGNPNPGKTDLLAQIQSNPMMPTAQMYNLLGGTNYSNLFAPASQDQYSKFLNKNLGLGTPQQQSPDAFRAKVNSLQGIPDTTKNQLFGSYINPNTGNYIDDLQKLLQG